MAESVTTELEIFLESTPSSKLKRPSLKQLPIERVDRSLSIPLSFAQQRLWFLAQMVGVGDAYHISSTLRLTGELNYAALRQALDRILTRHEVLRTIFVLVDGSPIQRIALNQDSRFPLREDDLRQQHDIKCVLDHLVIQEASAAFDLEVGLLLRGRLIRLADDEHALLITMHHIVSDDWSMDIFIKELTVLYGAFRQGQTDPLPELEIQYADYAVWQRRWIEGEVLKNQADYWKETLAHAPALLELPTDRPRSVQKDYAGAFASLVLDEELTSGLKDLSNRHGATLYMTLMAAWAILLARLSGQEDLIIGTPAANRGRAEIENLIGFFANTLALRVDLSSSPTVSELLAQVKAQTIAAQQHQDIPFEQVIEIMQPVRSLAHSPLFQVMFVWQNISEDRLALPGLKQRSLQAIPHVIAKFDLTLSLREAESKIIGGLEYATSLFDSSTIQRYLGYLRNLIEAMIADDTQRVNRLPMLTEQERHQLLYEWNDTKAEYPAERCVHQLFEEQVEKTPDAIAVVFEKQELSYRELNRRSNQLAYHLLELGVKPDSRVALCLERSCEMIIGVLAVLKAGGAYVPLDTAYPLDRLRFMLDDSEPVALLTKNRLWNLFPQLSHTLPVLDIENAALWQLQPETNPDSTTMALTPNNVAYVIYTSGSTGQPKGVLVRHMGVTNRIIWMQSAYTLNEHDAVLQKTPFGFDVSVWEFFWPLIAGAKLVMARPEGHKSLIYLDQVIQRNQITTLHFVPPMLQIFLDSGAKYSSLLRVICSGETLPTSIAEQFQKQMPTSALHNLYGPTEATVDVTAWTCTADMGQAASIPIGRPIANTQVYILDSYGEPAPIGVSGELHIGGAGVARGYLNRPELTAERFPIDPFATKPGARMYRTGDIGRWLPNGNIEFLGRNDFQVKIRGYRIELGEIEASLARHSGIREAVVIAREYKVGDKRLVAYYTPALNSGLERDPLDADELRSYLSATLPEHMMPAAYVRLELLPLTPNGKLDRKALPAPDAYATHGYESPQGETESVLAAIWAEVLNLNQVGRHDNFFSLGGHSLLAVWAVTRIKHLLGVKVAINDLFMYTTVKALATKLNSQLSSPVTAEEIL